MTQLNGHVYTCACGGRWSASTVVRGGTLDEVSTRRPRIACWRSFRCRVFACRHTCLACDREMLPRLQQSKGGKEQEHPDNN